MKQCPSCRRTYADDTLSFCLEDGSPLAPQTAPEITQRYTPPATERFETPRDTAPPPAFQFNSPVTQTALPRRSKKIWIIPAALALLLAVSGIGIAAFLLLKNKSVEAVNSNDHKVVSNTAAVNLAKENETNSNTAASNANPANTLVSKVANTDTSKSTPSPDEDDAYTADNLVGTWESDVVEQRVKTHITYTINDDGTTKMLFKTSDGRTGNDHGTWRFSKGILYEKYSDGRSGKGALKMINDDTFQITILDNGDAAYKGVKRVYRRR